MSQEKLQVFRRNERTRLMVNINNTDIGCFIFENITIANSKRIFKSPVFYIFTEEHIEDELLKDLGNINFK